MRRKKRSNHKFTCMVDGMEYPSNEKRIRWDGLIVHYKNLDQRHPQDLIKSVRDDTSVENPSPEHKSANATFVNGADEPSFGLVDEFGNFIVDEFGEFVIAPPPGVVLS